MRKTIKKNTKNKNTKSRQTNRKNTKKKKIRPLTQSNVKALSQVKKTARIKKLANSAKQSILDSLFDNLITVEELAVVFGLAPQTIRNWIALGKIPHVKLGRKHFLQGGSVQEWLNQKEEPRWR